MTLAFHFVSLVAFLILAGLLVRQQTALVMMQSFWKIGLSASDKKIIGWPVFSIVRFASVLGIPVVLGEGLKMRHIKKEPPKVFLGNLLVGVFFDLDPQKIEIQHSSKTATSVVFVVSKPPDEASRKKMDDFSKNIGLSVTFELIHDPID